MSEATSARTIRVGDWVVEPALDTISRDGRIEKLEPRTMRLLMCLVDARGDVVSIDRLLSEVWVGVIVAPASVYQAISQLRKLLGDTDPEPSYVATVPRKGYRLVARVRPVEAPAATPERSPPQPAPLRPLAAPTDPSRAPSLAAPLPPAAPTPPPAALPLLAAPSSRSPNTAKSHTRRWAIAGILIIALSGLTVSSWRHLFDSDDSPASIVVLPFADLTAEKHDQPFCDGLTEELANWLAQIPSLRVVARTSSFAFRGRDADVRDIARALHTNHVLEGSMRRSGDHVRVTVQLIDARTGYHLWSASYDQQTTDAIRIQEDISRSVAENLQIRLTAATAERFAARGSANPQAYQSYLLARQYQQQRTAESNTAAIDLYRRILVEDPRFALAYVGLAYALLNEIWLGSRSMKEVASEADPLLARAMKLGANLSDVYAVRGALRAEQFRTDEALRDLRNAVRINPNDSVAYKELGHLYLVTLGRPRDALLNYTEAADLDPLDYLPQAQRCLAFQDLGQFTDAAEACGRARTLRPQAHWPLVASSWLEAAQGRLDLALRWNELALKAAPDVFELYDDRATWLLILGMPSEARATLELARKETGEDEEVNDSLAQVAYFEGGVTALQAHLATARLQESKRAARLFSLAYYQLLAENTSAAKASLERALAAEDFTSGMLESPWDASRWGHVYDMTAALVELRTGDAEHARGRLKSVGETLDNLIANGGRRYGINELRATVLALGGDDQGAVRALSRAAELGWRRSWWAEREPDLASLRSRSDFRELLARVNESNAELRNKLGRQPR